MTAPQRRTAEEVLYAVADLLVEYRDQCRADAEALEEQSEAIGTVPDQAAPLPRAQEAGDLPSEGHLTTPPVEQAVPAPEIAAPWAAFVDEDQTRKRSTTTALSATLHAKIQWVTHNVPKMSQQKLMQIGAEAEADRLITLYYRPN